MLIGLDFDNTLVSYDALFHRVARERDVIPEELPVNKTAVRDYLRGIGQEGVWTEMQGEVYGGRMEEADIFPGAIDFFLACRESKIEVCIISHKTRFPYSGEKYDLHAAARLWLIRQGFFDSRGLGLTEDEVFFEPTKSAKLARIGACGCAAFIDDLTEILSDPGFPLGVRRYHFDPSASFESPTAFDGVGDWSRLAGLLLPEPAWATSARSITGLSSDVKFVARAGGANNRVFSGGDSVLIKRYFSHPEDPRDRFSTEQAFYHYLSACGATQTPRVFGWDLSARFGAFSLEPGTPPRRVESSHVEAALDFVRQLNLPKYRLEAANLPDASEACFSIEAHLATVARRVQGLGTMSGQDALGGEARTFLHEVLEPAWTEVVQQIHRHTAPSERATELILSERCVSPSDFGFHNSLVHADGRVVFLDFEYAGWDDPAKLVGDFFSQPEYPVSEEFFPTFVAGLKDVLQLTEATSFEKRCHLLLPLYQIKWSCILLNEFTLIGRQRRAFALGEVAAAKRRGRQLSRARELLNRLRIAA